MQCPVFRGTGYNWLLDILHGRHVIVIVFVIYFSLLLINKVALENSVCVTRQRSTSMARLWLEWPSHFGKLWIDSKYDVSGMSLKVRFSSFSQILQRCWVSFSKVHWHFFWTGSQILFLHEQLLDSIIGLVISCQLYLTNKVVFQSGDELHRTFSLFRIRCPESFPKSIGGKLISFQ